jgi:copper transport protein
VWSALDATAIGDVLETRYGTLAAVRAGAWALLAAVVLWPRIPRALGLVPLAALAVAPALSGHASTHDPELMLVPFDVVHVVAVSLWFGGLVSLIGVVPAATRSLAAPARTRLLTAVLERFSPLALGCVIALASTGVAEAILYLDSLGELLDTDFGRAISIKALLLGGLVALGAVNRYRLLPWLERIASRGVAPGRAGLLLRRTLRTEVALVAATLGVAAVLVADSPPSGASGIVSGSTAAGEAELEYTVDPALAGANRMHLYLFDAQTGAPYREAREVTASLELSEHDIGPLDAELRRSGPGHWVAPAAPFGTSGEWTVEVSVRVSRFEQDEASFQVEIK